MPSQHKSVFYFGLIISQGQGLVNCKQLPSDSSFEGGEDAKYNGGTTHLKGRNLYRLCFVFSKEMLGY